MTVVIGIICSDGVIIATDSQTTSGNVALPAIKARTINGAAAVWSAAGSVYVIEEVQAALAAKVETQLQNDGENKWKRMFSDPDVNAIREHFANVVRSAMRSCYEAAMPGYIPPEFPPGQHMFGTDFLFSGIGHDEKFLLEIASDGQMNWHTDRGFYAMGSGGEFATVAMELMKPYVQTTPLDLKLGQIVAYRTIETTCDVSAGLVSGPVQMVVADSNGARVLTKEDLYDVQELVERWKLLERNLFLSLLGDPNNNQDMVEIPDSLAD